MPYSIFPVGKTVLLLLWLISCRSSKETALSRALGSGIRYRSLGRGSANPITSQEPSRHNRYNRHEP